MNDGDFALHAQAEREIEALMSCYAYGSDALGRAIDAPINTDLTSWENVHVSKLFREGVRYYRRCSTQDWIVSGYSDAGGVIIPLIPKIKGAVAWANQVNNGARTAGQRDSQHLFGSISSTVDGDTGTLRAYSIVHFMYLPGTPNAGKVQVFTIEYNSKVVSEDGRWRLKETVLRLSSSALTDGIIFDAPS